MNESGSVREISATGADVQMIVEQIEPILMGFPRHHVLIACITLAMLMQHPDISPTQLQEGVKGVSQWMALFLSTTGDDGVTPKELLN
jgi:hypothetical protein